MGSGKEWHCGLEKLLSAQSESMEGMDAKRNADSGGLGSQGSQDSLKTWDGAIMRYYGTRIC